MTIAHWCANILWRLRERGNEITSGLMKFVGTEKILKKIEKKVLTNGGTFGIIVKLSARQRLYLVN